MTLITVAEPTGGRAAFTPRGGTMGALDTRGIAVPGEIELPASTGSEYVQVTLRSAGATGGGWSDTFAVQIPTTGTHALADLERIATGEAGAGGAGLADRVAALEATSGEWGQLADRVESQEEVLWLVEDIVEDNLLGTISWHEAAQIPNAAGSYERDLLIDLPGGEYATGHVRVSLHVVTEDVRGLERFTTSSVPAGVPFTAVPLAEGDTHRHLVQVDYPADPGARQLRLRFRPSSGTISGRVGYTRPVFGSPREVSA